ncbi:MAG TPA: GvpL/GvpF family gas vesicle protein [Candidatus Limnocylindria bacterium]|nr:GvpL/GvpF family gas vesicle protein [Candidatus Limnocylindria bacterium]
MDDYLYALVEGLPPAWRAPASGVGGAAVTVRRHGERFLIMAAVDSVPAASARTLAVHHEVVASALDAQAVLPFRYATLAGTLGADAWLAGRRDAIESSLALIRGSVEMTVKLLRLDCSVPQHPAAGAGGGGSPDERELRRLGEHLIAHAGLPHARYRPAGTAGNVAASVAFLVPSPEVPAFLTRIAPIASRATGLAVVPTGPWPAYSFVPPFDRLPLARAAPTAPLSVERRAG